MNQEVKLDVLPETVQAKGTILHGLLNGTFQGKQIGFMVDTAIMDIIIPESLEPIYPYIEDAVVRYLKAIGKME